MNLDELLPLGEKFTAALEAVGIEVVRPTRKGGNVTGHELVEGGAIIVRLMGMSGWVVRERGAVEPRVERPGRASSASMLRLVRREGEVEVVGPDVHAGHAPDVNDEDHTDVTRPSP